ncbi:MAG: hypothetical protein RDV48_24490 [Candidatus Eremiobacteraeota bacterium]|nr:hypothetical protein [Candidatus Eremiobacteraeota bacterium]
MKKNTMLAVIALMSLVLTGTAGCPKKAEVKPDPKKQLIGSWSYVRITGSPSGEDHRFPVKIAARGKVQFQQNGTVTMEVQSKFYKDAPGLAEKSPGEFSSPPLGVGTSTGLGTFSFADDRTLKTDLEWNDTIYRCDGKGVPGKNPERTGKKKESDTFSILSLTADELTVKCTTTGKPSGEIRMKKLK